MILKQQNAFVSSNIRAIPATPIMARKGDWATRADDEKLFPSMYSMYSVVQLFSTVSPPSYRKERPWEPPLQAPACSPLRKAAFIFG